MVTPILHGQSATELVAVAVQGLKLNYNGSMVEAHGYFSDESHLNHEGIRSENHVASHIISLDQVNQTVYVISGGR